MKLVVLFCIVTHFVVANSKSVEFTFPEPCHRSDPNLKSCFLRQIQEGMPYVFQHGLPQYGTRAFDPLELPFMLVDMAVDDRTGAKGVLSDVKISGLSKYILKDLSIDGKNLVIEFEVVIPRLSMSLDANIAGKVLDVPVSFEGRVKGNYTDVTNHFKIHLKTVKRNGGKYLSVNKLKFKSTIADGKIAMLSKDLQAQPLLDFAANYINNNFKEVLNVLTPYYLNIAENFFTTEIDKGLSSVPAEKIFLD